MITNDVANEKMQKVNLTFSLFKAPTGLRILAMIPLWTHVCISGNALKVKTRNHVSAYF